MTATRLFSGSRKAKAKRGEAELLKSVINQKNGQDFLTTVAEIDRRNTLPALEVELKKYAKKDMDYENREQTIAQFALLGNDDFDKREKAQQFLERMLTNVGNDFLEKEVMPLHSVALQSKDAEVRRRAEELRTGLTQRMRYETEFGIREARLRQAVDLIKYQRGD